MTTVSNSLIAITLLVELGVAAAVSSSLARSKTFRNLLLLPQRSFAETTKLVAIICAPLVAGVWIRVRVPNFLAADISFEATILLGILLGPLAAMAGAAAMALPAMWHGEYWTLPVNLAVAAIAGAFGRFADVEDVWSFSPLIDLSIYRWVTRQSEETAPGPADSAAYVNHGGVVRDQPVGAYLSAQILRFVIRAPGISRSLSCLCSPVVVGIPLKIWNQIRIEQKLEEQSRLLLEARLGCAAAADQPALSVQYAELDHVAGAIEAGAGARDDREAGEFSAHPAQESRGVCSVRGRACVYGRLSRHRGSAVW